MAKKVLIRQKTVVPKSKDYGKLVTTKPKKRSA